MVAVAFVPVKWLFANAADSQRYEGQLGLGTSGSAGGSLVLNCVSELEGLDDDPLVGKCWPGQLFRARRSAGAFQVGQAVGLGVVLGVLLIELLQLAGLDRALGSHAGLFWSM
jgi:hypothetical protein